MNIETAYSSWAPRYDSDRNLTRDLDQTVTTALLHSCRIAMTIEAGCGTGKNTAFFAGISDVVLALDFSPGMLARARQRTREANVDFRRADLTEPWPCIAGTAALVSCNLVLEHIENIDHVFSEAARVLAADGLFLVSELHPHRQYLGSQARFTDERQIETRITAYTHHISDFLRAASAADLRLVTLEESWHPEDDTAKSPRLISFMFRKPAHND